MSQKKKTKAELIDAIYQKNIDSDEQVSRDTIRLVVDGLFDEMKASLIEGNPIELRGFGVFEFRYRKQKENARNPKTGKKVTVPGHSVVAFRSGNEIKEAVWVKEYGKKTSE